MKIPSFQNKPSVWYGPQMEKRKEEWQWILSKEEILEIERAAESVLLKKIELQTITAEHFPLGKLAQKFNALKNTLIKGIGFALIKGLPSDQYSEEELYTIFLGIGAHLGNIRSQNAMGHLLGHVKNLGLSSKDPKVRIYQTKERQSFHTDSCDVVGLLCVKPAKSGGLSLLVSSDTVFNEMKRQRPELLKLLFDPIATDRRGEVPEAMLPYLLIPVYSYFQKNLTIFYQRQYIESAQRFPEAPRLTDKHYETLDFFESLCNDPAIHMNMMLEKGDMQFVYNHAMLHDRTGFEDWKETEKQRHLLRMWLSIQGDRELPEIFTSRFGSIEIGNRGGIIIPGTKLRIPSFTDILDN